MQPHFGQALLFFNHESTFRFMCAPHGFLAVQRFYHQLPTSVPRVSICDAYLHLPVMFQRLAELWHIQRSFGVGDAEDLIEADSNSAMSRTSMGTLTGGTFLITAPLIHFRMCCPREFLTLRTFSLSRGHKSGTHVKRRCDITIPFAKTILLLSRLILQVCHCDH